MSDLEGLRPFACTDRQLEILEAVITHGGIRPAARELGIDQGNVSRCIKRIRGLAAKQGHSPEHDMNKTCPDGFQVKGVSTLYGRDGEQKIQWVKTSVDRERQSELMQEALESLVSDLPQLEPSLYQNSARDDLMAVYPLGDPHIGVLCWAAETGQDWDLAIAERAFLEVFDRLVKTAPPCKQSVIVNLGDYFHYDNMEGVTTRSGHSLDTDGRYAKMVSVGMDIMRRMIESALERHETVRIINACGNHDDTSSMFLAVALDHIYENEPRVVVDKSPTPFHYVEFGKNLIGVHHGHSCKSDRLPGVMAADKPEEWGRTIFRTWLTGHIHHDTKKEHAGCTTESFRTLAAKDSYATWGGYRSLQDSKCLVLHADHGEIERHTVSIKQLDSLN